MIGLVMAGGRGSRMHPHTEKLTMSYYAPVALRVVRALRSCRAITAVVAAVSPNAPRTGMMLKEYADTIHTPGSGYSVDLAHALGMMDGPVLVVPGDLPLLDGRITCRLSEMHDAGHWTTFMVSESYAARLGLSGGVVHPDAPCRYTGISIVDASRLDLPPRYVVMDDYRLAANMNTMRDWALLGAAHYLTEDYSL